MQHACRLEVGDLPHKLHLASDVQRVHRLAGRPSLLSNQGLPQHLLCELPRLGSGCDVNSALEPRRKLAQSTTTSKDLALEHDLMDMQLEVSAIRG